MTHNQACMSPSRGRRLHPAAQVFLGRMFHSVVLSCLLACGTQSQGKPFSLVDATGVVTVHIPNLPQVNSRRLALLDTIAINAGRGFDLFRVAGARVLQNHSIIIANSGANEILLVDSAGNLVRRIGRAGDGPGEFRDLVSMQVLPDDLFQTYDARQGRLTTFDTSGRVHRTAQLMPQRRNVDLLPLARTETDEILAVYGSTRLFDRQGVARDTTPLLVLTVPGAVRDTLGVWEGKEWLYHTGASGSARTPIGFSRDVVYAGQDSQVVIGGTDSLDLSVFRGSKLVMRFLGTGNTQVPREMMRTWRSDLVEQLADAPADIKRAFEETPAHSTLPALQGVAVSDSLQVWLGVYPSPRSRRADWLVFDSFGELVGSVSLPVDARILAVAYGRLVLLQHDEMGVEALTVMRLGDNQR